MGYFYYTAIGGATGILLDSNGDSRTIYDEYSTNANIYDPSGWSWGKFYMDTHVLNKYNNNAEDPWLSCSKRRRRRILSSRRNLLIVTVGNYTFDFTPPNITSPTCNPALQTQIDTACQTARDKQSICCSLIGTSICDQIQKNCELDVCVSIAGDMDLIALQINETVTQSIQSVCNLAKNGNIPIIEDPDNLVTAAPTSAPTDFCVLGRGFAVKGNNAYASGDPHFVKFKLFSFSDVYFTFIK